jgi:hypothetical protein
MNLSYRPTLTLRSVGGEIGFQKVNLRCIGRPSQDGVSITFKVHDPRINAKRKNGGGRMSDLKQSNVVDGEARA